MLLKLKRISIADLYAATLVVFPLVNSYRILGISPNFLFCFMEFSLIFLLLRHNQQIKIDNRVYIYFIYMVASATMGIVLSEQNFFYSLFVKISIYTLSFFIFYISSWQIIDFNFVSKLYIRIAMILSVLIMIQFMFSLIGKGFSLVPSGMHLINGDSSETIRAIQIANDRYSTIFLEPAHQCEYLLPCLALLLFRDENNNKNFDLVLAIIVTIGFFCTTSSIGIFSSAIMWSYFGVTILKKRKILGVVYLLLLIPVLLIVSIFFLRIEYVNKNLIERLEVLNFNSNIRTEGFRRIRYGWLCYFDLGVVQKFLGAGYRNFGYYLADTGIGYKLLGTNETELISYTNGITGMLIGLGLIGTILNLRLFFGDCIRTKNSLIYSLLIVWGIIMFTSSSFDSIVGVMPMILAMNLSLKPKSVKSTIKLVARSKKC